MSVMEMSHRSKAFEAIVQERRPICGKLMGIPDTHAVLFLQGGASLQFAMIPHEPARAGTECGLRGYRQLGAERRIKEGKLAAG